MIGAVAGDIIGSVYEGLDIHDPQTGRLLPTFDDFEPLFHPLSRFTDDTVLTVAIAEHLLEGGDLAERLHEYATSYPSAGYGGSFRAWVSSGDRRPYSSWGNGAAMRISPVAHAFDTLREVVDAAAKSAAVTHDHPEGIKGAQATAAAVFLARTGASRETIRQHIEGIYGYDLSRPLSEIRPTLGFDVSCQGTVPPAIRAFLESNSYEHAVRLAISLGGDADTLACIAGSIAGPFHGVPDSIRQNALSRLDDRLRAVVQTFEQRYRAASCSTGVGRASDGPASDARDGNVSK